MYLDSDGTRKYPYQTSWGVSTRLIGALIMVHGDNRGLCLPPYVAPIQAVIIPVAAHKPGVTEKSREIYESLKNAGIRVKLDETDNSPGWKFNEYEMKGVPVRVEIGPRDIEKGEVVYSRRDKPGEKFTMPIDVVAARMSEILADINLNMYEKALNHLKSHTIKVSNMEEIKAAVDSGCFARRYVVRLPRMRGQVKAGTASHHAQYALRPDARRRQMRHLRQTGYKTHYFRPLLLIKIKI